MLCRNFKLIPIKIWIFYEFLKLLKSLTQDLSFDKYNYLTLAVLNIHYNMHHDLWECSPKQISPMPMTFGVEPLTRACAYRQK